MAKKPSRNGRRTRRNYSREYKAEAVQMLLDGHSVASVAKNLGLSGTNLLYRWKADILQQSGPAATAMDSRIHELGDVHEQGNRGEKGRF